MDKKPTVLRQPYEQTVLADTDAVGGKINYCVGCGMRLTAEPYVSVGICRRCAAERGLGIVAEATGDRRELRGLRDRIRRHKEPVDKGSAPGSGHGATIRMPLFGACDGADDDGDRDRADGEKPGGVTS